MLKTARQLLFKIETTHSNCSFSKLRNLHHQHVSTKNNPLILGIETSCDDTGCAIVDSDGKILGEALNSQHLTHLNNGGIIPPIAQTLHRQNMESVVIAAVKEAGIGIEDVDAIATTVKPGLPLSLMIGLKYGKYLCRKYNKPLIPIHHMEAHALTCRMHDKTVNFPFLVLLISGGHCLIAVVRNVDEFLLLGESIDDAPGEAFDKMARRMKLRNIPEFLQMSGGQAVELAASRAKDPLQFKFSTPLLQYKDCNFSMAGIKNQVWRHVTNQERIHGLPPDAVIPDVYNLCAGFQLTITRHLCHRIQRAMHFAEMNELIPPEEKTLVCLVPSRLSKNITKVVSGGAACNNFIAKALEIVCGEMGYRLVRPPPILCTDNGVMIAWNGVERYNAGIGITTDYDSIKEEKDCPLGISLIDKVKAANLSCKWVRLRVLNKPQCKEAMTV